MIKIIKHKGRKCLGTQTILRALRKSTKYPTVLALDTLTGERIMSVIEKYCRKADIRSEDLELKIYSFGKAVLLQTRDFTSEPKHIVIDVTENELEQNLHDVIANSTYLAITKRASRKLVGDYSVYSVKH